jgi:hypothetical protein
LEIKRIGTRKKAIINVETIARTTGTITETIIATCLQFQEFLIMSQAMGEIEEIQIGVLY